MRELLVVVMVLGLASGLAAEESDEIVQLKERIAELQAALYPCPNEQNRTLLDLNNMRQIAGLLAVSSARGLPMKDGALDVYRLYRKGDLTEKRLVAFRSERRGVAPSLEELKQEDYTHFPYERWHGAAPPKALERIPILWDRVPQSDGTRLVAMASGAAVVMQEAKLQDLLRVHGQLTLTYSKRGVSFAYPRRFRIAEKKTPAGPMVFVDDPATPHVDAVIGVHGKMMPGFFGGMYVGLKKGIKVKTTLEETEIKERIDGEEVAGKKLVYLREGDESKRVLRFLTIRKTHSVTVATVFDDDARVYPKLQSILRSIKIEKAEAKVPPKQEEKEFD